MKTRTLLKSSLLFVSIAILFVLVFMIPPVLIPVSDTMLEMLNPEEMKLFFPLLIVLAVYVSVTFMLVLNNMRAEKKSIVFITISVAFFLMYAIMGFLESVYWGYAFKGVETSEFVRILIRFTITFTLFSGFLALVSKKGNTLKLQHAEKINLKQMAIKLTVISVIYYVIYNLFGYFVAFQFEETRYFYTGSYELEGFFSSMWQNISNPGFVAIHLFRGVLFGIAAFLFYSLLNCSRAKKIVILSLILGGFGFQIILPNPLLPEIVRISHFLETTSSMLIFGALAGYVLSYKTVETSEIR